MVLAENGNVRDDVLGGDVAGNDDKAGERGVSRASGGRLAERLDNLLDTTLEGASLGSYSREDNVSKSLFSSSCPVCSCSAASRTT